MLYLMKEKRIKYAEEIDLEIMPVGSIYWLIYFPLIILSLIIIAIIKIFKRIAKTLRGKESG